MYRCAVRVRPQRRRSAATAWRAARKGSVAVELALPCRQTLPLHEIVRAHPSSWFRACGPQAGRRAAFEGRRRRGFVLVCFLLSGFGVCEYFRRRRSDHRHRRSGCSKRCQGPVVDRYRCVTVFSSVTAVSAAGRGLVPPVTRRLGQFRRDALRSVAASRGFLGRVGGLVFGSWRSWLGSSCSSSLHVTRGGFDDSRFVLLGLGLLCDILPPRRSAGLAPCLDVLLGHTGWWCSCAACIWG